MAKSREPRNNCWPMHIWSRVPKTHMEKGESFPQTVLGKLNVHTQSNKIRLLSYNTHKIQLERDEKLTHKTGTLRLLAKT